MKNTFVDAANVALQVLESIRVTNPALIADSMPADWGMIKLREALQIDNTKAADGFVTLNLNVFDDDGNVVDGTTSTLSHQQISDIVDHASQLILVRRDGQSLDNVLNELDEALSVADVIDAPGTSTEGPRG